MGVWTSLTCPFPPETKLPDRKRLYEEATAVRLIPRGNFPGRNTLGEARPALGSTTERRSASRLRST